MRSPFTGIIFAIELTHDLNMLLPLLVACFLAHTFTVLTLKRSILTEKISRRGYHLSREYGLDPLEILFVREVMRTNIVALPCDGTLQEAQELVHHERRPRGQYLFPVVDSERGLRGVVTRKQLLTSFEERRGEVQTTRIADIASTEPTVAFADEPLGVVVRRMAESGLTRFPVLDPLDRTARRHDLAQRFARRTNPESWGGTGSRESVADSHAFRPSSKSSNSPIA